MLRRLFHRQTVPWVLTVLFALAFLVVLLTRTSSKPQVRKTPTNVERAATDVVQDATGRRVTAWVDPMYSLGPPHLYKSNKPGRAPDCDMKLVPVYAEEASQSATVPSSVEGYSNVALSPAREQLIGVKLARAELRPLGGALRTTGIVASDERRAAQIHAKFEGVIESLQVNVTGQLVRRGDPLLSIYSPDLLATQQELLLAERTHSDLGRTLAGAARNRLLLWDMSRGDIDRVVRGGKPIRAVTLRSPANGVVVTKNAVIGMRVMPADTLFQVVDLSSVWILADIYEFDLPFVRLGETAEVTLPSTGRTWPGHITFVAPVVDPATRTAKVRIELANPDGALKPEMYVNVTLQKPGGAVVVVPDSSVMQTGTRSIVFVQTGPGQYAPREVRVGSQAEGFYEIRQGVQAGETVVADANFLVDSESRLKSAIGGMAGMPGMTETGTPAKTAPPRTP